MLKLYNTLTRSKEEFAPIEDGKVGLYTCGPTVYHYLHIGNLRSYVFEDVLRRTLEYHGYRVNHVMNITDVGHLTDDADAGEDKMEKGSRREGKSAGEIAAFYTDAALRDFAALNILPAHTVCKATDHIPEQIAMVQQLVDKGFTYITHDGIYFDTTKLEDYGKLANLAEQELEPGARVAMGEKKNPHDFALWKFSDPGEQRQMEWEAFGKLGFPGWHIECSAMSLKYLGDHFDIHCGGVDHIPVHHTNEIAQTEALTGKKPWVNYWLHNEHLTIGGEKMAKSGDNFLTLQTLREKGIAPLAYRYFLLQTHYRKQLSFSWEAIKAAQTGYHKLCKAVAALAKPAIGCAEFEDRFLESISDDLNTPQALALLWELLKSDYPDSAKKATILKMDQVLGLNLAAAQREEIVVPKAVQALLDEREVARAAKNFTRSDELREEIKTLGYIVEDTADGQFISGQT